MYGLTRRQWYLLLCRSPCRRGTGRARNKLAQPGPSLRPFSAISPPAGLATAGVMLWRVGSTASPSEVVEAVASCRTAGKDAAAETVLSSASERADRQAVLNITAALHKAGQHMDVAYLLSAAAQD